MKTFIYYTPKKYFTEESIKHNGWFYLFLIKTKTAIQRF